MVAVCVAALCAGCGSGGSSGEVSAAISAPSAEFTEKGGNDVPASFGVVADGEEREAAEQILEESLAARAAGEWAKQCATLSAEAIGKIESDAPNFGGGKGCMSGLRAEAKPLAQTKAVRADTFTGAVAVFRVKGKTGYAIYHGAKGQDYALRMEKEDGGWKVARVETTKVP